MRSPIKSLRKLTRRRKESKSGAEFQEVFSQEPSTESDTSPTTPVLTQTKEETPKKEGLLKSTLNTVTAPVKKIVDFNPIPINIDIKNETNEQVNGDTSEKNELEPIVENSPNEEKKQTKKDSEVKEDHKIVEETEAAKKMEDKIGTPPKETNQPEIETVKKEEEPREETQVAPTYTVDANTVLVVLMGISGCFWVLIALIFGYSTWQLIKYTVLFTALSLVYMYFYAKNQQKKQRGVKIMNVTPGVSGLTELMKQSPTWLTYTKKEKIIWFNKFLAKTWPFYDKAVCDAIKESVEPTMQSVKPPIFKDIKFRSLKFGIVPFKVEGVEIETTDTEIIIDMDIRWSGDATVSLAIEPNIPSITEATTMCPTVKDLSCFGTMRLILKPLVPEIPGFGAITASFVKTPSIRFHCDFGRALGGNMSGNMVKSALDPFIKDTLVNMFTWPQRMVIPIIYDEKMNHLIEDLQLRHVGLLTVKVIEARDLPAADMNNSSDPLVELYTRPNKVHKTEGIKKNLNPVWDDEVHHLLVQEPRSQNLHVTTYDIDAFNASEMLKSVNFVKNVKDSVNAKELLGRSLISLREITEKPATEVNEWYDLGKGEFGDLHGPGSGSGSVHLKILYTPFSMLQVEDSKKGVVLVDILRCRDLEAKDRSGTSDPYVKVKIGEQQCKTQVINACCDPEFHAKFEFFDVPISQKIQFSAFDKDLMSKDDPLGILDIKLQDLADSQVDDLPGQMRQWFALQQTSQGEIQLKLQYIPMDTIKQFTP